MTIWRTEIRVFTEVLKAIELEAELGQGETVADLSESESVEIQAPQLIEMLKFVYDEGIRVGVRLTGKV